MTVDFIIHLSGSMVGFAPCNGEAVVWVDENIEREPWQWLGGVLWVDARYAEPILEGLRLDGYSYRIN